MTTYISVYAVKPFWTATVFVHVAFSWSRHSKLYLYLIFYVYCNEVYFEKSKRTVWLNISLWCTRVFINMYVYILQVPTSIL